MRDEEKVIEVYNKVKGMVYQVLREREESRNSQEWVCHIVQRECAEKYYSKELHELSKDERLSLPKRSTIARSMREIQNNKPRQFVPDEAVEIEKEVKRKALHNSLRQDEKVVD